MMLLLLVLLLVLLVLLQMLWVLLQKVRGRNGMVLLLGWRWIAGTADGGGHDDGGGGRGMLVLVVSAGSHGARAGLVAAGRSVAGSVHRVLS